MKTKMYFLYPKINPLRWIYFRRENKTISRYDLFLTFLLFLVVDSSSASGQIPPSLPETPIEQWPTTPPPHRSQLAILCINCRAAKAKEGSVTVTLPSL